jgi:Uri superfamily endonuclease
MQVVPGVYQLRIRLRRARVIAVGALGESRFPAGWYVYTGSARNGLAQRIGRHLRRRKRKHWHIDYLLAVADGVEVFVVPGTIVTECELHGMLTGGEVVVPGFGASDCRCRAHLAWFRRKPKIGLVDWPEFVRHSIA